MQPTQLSTSDVFGQGYALQRLNHTIAPGDGMLSGGTRHYYVTGASALACIREGLDAAHVRADFVTRILDYACGYGRVLRWLKAGFPTAALLGVDADPKAAKAAGTTLGVETRQLDISLSAKLNSEPFDLIWVGSLLTHLPSDEIGRVLRYLREHLKERGVLVVTMHGPLVAGRLRSKERLYNLSADAAERVASDYEETGFGYADYPTVNRYGISIARASRMMSIIEGSDLYPIFYRERGWAVHQDVYACVPGY